MSRKPISSVKAFVREVHAHYRAEGRHGLPWRKTHDPYAVMVSEIMLQQTQVDRVVPFFERFLAEFPSVEALARAPLARVLIAWQGLGYNRRAKMLHQAAREIVERHEGHVPRSREDLQSLSGIGPYTAGAIRAFAYDEPELFIETNIRAALIHHFFSQHAKVADTELMPLIQEALKHVESSREWYSALMDYGTHIKKLHKNPARRSVHHVRQSRFEGSLRQARGAILRQLTTGPAPDSAIRKIDAKSVIRVQSALKSLHSEGLIEKYRGKWRLSHK